MDLSIDSLIAAHLRQHPDVTDDDVVRRVRGLDAVARVARVRGVLAAGRAARRSATGHGTAASPATVSR